MLEALAVLGLALAISAAAYLLPIGVSFLLLPRQRQAVRHVDPYQDCQ